MTDATSPLFQMLKIDTLTLRNRLVLEGLPINRPQVATFYRQDAEGYTDLLPVDSSPPPINPQVNG